MGKLPPESPTTAAINEVDGALKDDGYGTYMRRRDVESALSLSSSTVYALTSDGYLETIKIVNQHRFRRRDVARFAVMGRVAPNKPSR